MNLPILSIVVPFYNVEQYINKCLESIYSQDISEYEYEVICVNDGSPDKSREIVIEFQKNHSNLKLIEHKQNKKLGAARNTGRAIAKGKYIWNVDSDDYIQPNVLKLLTQECKKNDLDILVFNFSNLINNEEVKNIAYPFINSNVQSGLDFVKKYCLEHFSEISPVWTQIYKREFLKKNNIISPEFNYAEDAPFTFKALFLAGRIKSIDNVCYVYRIGINSIGSLIEKEPSAQRLYEKCFISTRELLSVKSVIPENEKNILLKFSEVYKYTISLFPTYLKRMNNTEYIKFKSICRKHFFSDLKIITLLGNKKLIYYLLKVIGPFR